MNNQLLIVIALLVVVVGLTALSGWLYLQYSDQKTNVDSKIAVAEAAARKQQSKEDDAKVKAIEEEPNREFAGPEDYGRLSFKYPKNWSVYVAESPSIGSSKFTAYFNPITVPSLNDRAARYALTVLIENTAYDRVLDSYKKTIEKGDLKSSQIKVGDHEGVRLDGTLEKDVKGSAALFRVRDKTITVTSQAETFKDYFDAILKTVDFND